MCVETIQKTNTDAVFFDYAQFSTEGIQKTVSPLSDDSANPKTEQGAVGSIVGHEKRQSGYTNYLKINNCSVINTKLQTSDSGDWRVGEFIDTVAGQKTPKLTLKQHQITNCSRMDKQLLVTTYTAVSKMMVKSQLMNDTAEQ